MDTLLLLLALLLPTLMGGLWVQLWLPGGIVARPALVWGCGALFGLILTPQLMRLLNAYSQPLAFNTVAAVLAASIALALLLQITIKKHRKLHATVVGREHLMGWVRWVYGFLLALIALRLVTLFGEIYWRPLFPWDATMHWATKSRVWFEYKAITPFIDHGPWLERGGEGLFTDRHPDYPPTIPLLQVWVNLALGEWNESLMNIPWLVCYAALGLMFYAQLRAAKTNALTSLAFTYLLMSMPLANIHVALAGYADLFLAAVYCGALMALHGWATTRRWWQAVLALLFAALCPLIKNEGTMWAMTLLPAFGAAILTPREAAKFVLLLSLLALLIVLLLPQDIIIAGHTLEQLALDFEPKGLVGIAKSVWLHDNWHLLGYLIMTVLPLGAIMPGMMLRHHLPLSVALGAAVALFLFLFTFTGYGWGATNFTAVGRLSLHLAPSFLFLCALFFSHLLQREKLREATARGSGDSASA